ncbi:MAG: ABC-F family ATP-binding cassette domain-containing protein [Burkholderiales bacterium]|nr:ABC-F family ATP-binding cassette domain-containing protein [Anaerolineae bacterium]
MSLLVAKDLAKAYGPDDIFAGITVDIPQGARIALVGPNGAGKTTLLRILVGLDKTDEGTITRASGLQIGFLPQRPELVGNHSLWEEALTAFAEVRRMESELSRLEHAMGAGEDVLDQYGKLQERYEAGGGYVYETRIRTVLTGLGFTAEDYDTSLAQLSGGQKTRALLARLLLEEPELLALDEPTNHLDIEAVEWLESYLNAFPGAILAVSHDRYFMDAVARNIWELDYGVIETYRGNYSHYTQQREERHERLMKDFEAQREFIAKEEDYIRRNMAGQNTRQAQGRLKRLNRLKRDNLVRRPPKQRNLHLRIEATLRSGDKVLTTQGLKVGYQDDREVLLDVPNITLYRGETAALIGPNGVGKSTFLKTILGQLEPLGGETKLGASVQVGYFAQAHELLKPHNSIIDEILTVKPMQTSAARDYLAQFLFMGDDVFRPIETLSGGERGRVALAKLSLSGANFLLLDEPTNHLDIASQEILQDVLAAFEGTILLVSHDRYLVNALATQIWAARPGAMSVFKGPYKEYVTARDAAAQAAVSTPVSTPKSQTNKAVDRQAEKRIKGNGQNSRQMQKRVDEIEGIIHTLETRLENLTQAIGTASAAGNAGRVSELGQEYAQAEAELEHAMAEWEGLLNE